MPRVVLSKREEQHKQYLMKMSCNIYNRMKMKGLNNVKLANRFGVSDRTVSYWRKNPDKMQLGTLIALADVLDCTVEELFGISVDVDAMAKAFVEAASQMASGKEKVS